MFFTRALGSCREVLFQLKVAARLHRHADAGQVTQVQERARRVERMLARLIIKVRAGR